MVSGSNGALAAGETIQLSGDGGLSWHDVSQTSATTWSYDDTATAHTTSFSYMMGDYALAADAGLLTERKTPGGATEEIARLKGRRFVAVNETAENAHLNEARVKFITSQDTVTARNLYGHLFDFFPSHKTFVTTNHKPIIRGTDEGIWRRVQLIPFTVAIDKSRVEKDFRERRLLPELSGILNWALAGLAAYQQNGLSPPQAVLASTEGYREDMDVVGQWITQRCDLDPSSRLATATAFADYSAWANEEVGWNLGKLTFRRHLSDRGFAALKGAHGQRLIAGLRLKSTCARSTAPAASTSAATLAPTAATSPTGPSGPTGPSVPAGYAAVVAPAAPTGPYKANVYPAQTVSLGLPGSQPPISSPASDYGDEDPLDEALDALITNMAKKGPERRPRH